MANKKKKWNMKKKKKIKYKKIECMKNGKKNNRVNFKFGNVWIKFIIYL
jgi:hypothetical protein